MMKNMRKFFLAEIGLGCRRCTIGNLYDVASKGMEMLEKVKIKSLEFSIEIFLNFPDLFIAILFILRRFFFLIKL